MVQEVTLPFLQPGLQCTQGPRSNHLLVRPGHLWVSDVDLHLEFLCQDSFSWLLGLCTLNRAARFFVWLGGTFWSLAEQGSHNWAIGGCLSPLFHQFSILFISSSNTPGFLYIACSEMLFLCSFVPISPLRRRFLLGWRCS